MSCVNMQRRTLVACQKWANQSVRTFSQSAAQVQKTSSQQSESHAQRANEASLTSQINSQSKWLRSKPISSNKGAFLNENNELQYEKITPAEDAKTQVSFAFRVRHGSPAYILEACIKFEEQANKLNLYLKSLVPLPTKIKRWTFLRSPHVDKHSKEQFELRTHKRLITIETNSVKEEAQIEKLQQNLIGMVQNRVTMTCRIPAGVPIHTLTFRANRYEEDAIGKQEYDELTIEQENDLWDEEDDVQLSEQDLLFGEEHEWDEESDWEREEQQIDGQKDNAANKNDS